MRVCTHVCVCVKYNPVFHMENFSPGFTGSWVPYSSQEWMAWCVLKPTAALLLKVEVAQCPTLRSPKDCSSPDSPVDGTLQARMPEWVAIPFSRKSSQPRNWTRISWFTLQVDSLPAELPGKPWCPPYQAQPEILVKEAGDLAQSPNLYVP